MVGWSTTGSTLGARTEAAAALDRLLTGAPLGRIVRLGDEASRWIK
jgi:hypothetical protein